MKKIIKKYRLEIFFLSLAFIFTLSSLFLMMKEDKKENELIKINNQEKESFKLKIVVDVSGAVNKPGVYQFSYYPRLKEAVDKAGGLSDEADKDYFERNFNLAKYLFDQEKIYIPNIYEVRNGLFENNKLSFDYLSPVEINQKINENTDFEKTNKLISINQASLEELDQLPQVGKSIGQKIIDNRPYQSIDELLTKKVISQALFEKIKELITL